MTYTYLYATCNTPLWAVTYHKLKKRGKKKLNEQTIRNHEWGRRTLSRSINVFP